jgi:hypothetical protein
VDAFSGISEITSESIPIPSRPVHQSNRRFGVAQVAIVVVGLVLLAAGLLKLTAWAERSESGGIAGAILSRWLVFGLVEVALSLWLISGFAVRTSRILAVLFFTSTSAYGGYMLFKGQTTCSCFGAIQTPILLSLGVSLTCLTLLLFVVRRRSIDIVDSDASNRSWLLGVVGGALLSVAGLQQLDSAGVLRTHLIGGRSSLTAQIDNLRIEVNYFEGFDVRIPVRVANRSPVDAIQIVGWSAGCGAEIVLEGIPCTIGPGESRNVMMNVSRPGIPESLRSKAVSQFFDSPQPFDPTIVNPVSIRLRASDAVDVPLDVFVSLEPTESFLREWNQLKEGMVATNSVSGKPD